MSLIGQKKEEFLLSKILGNERRKDLLNYIVVGTIYFASGLIQRISYQCHVENCGTSHEE